MRLTVCKICTIGPIDKNPYMSAASCINVVGGRTYKRGVSPSNCPI